MQNTELIRKTLIHYNMTQCKLPNRPRRLFYLSAFLRLIYLLYELPNKPDKLPPSDTYIACCTSYQIGQTGFFWHFYNLLNCKTPNKSDRLFYSLTLDGFTICNQLGLDGKHRLYTTKVLDGIWSTCLIGLICRYHSNSCFKAIGG